MTSATIWLGNGRSVDIEGLRALCAELGLPGVDHPSDVRAVARAASHAAMSRAPRVHVAEAFCRAIGVPMGADYDRVADLMEQHGVLQAVPA